MTFRIPGTQSGEKTHHSGNHTQGIFFGPSEDKVSFPHLTAAPIQCFATCPVS